MDHVDSILAFLELLAQNGSRSHTLTSYVSVLKHFFRVFDLDIRCIVHRKIHLFVKSVSMNSKYFPRFKANFTNETLVRLANACDKVKYGIVYKAAFLLAYFAFLRLSNIAPPTVNAFDVTRHLLRSDVIFGSPGARIVLKWAKAMQSAVSSDCTNPPYPPFPHLSHFCPQSPPKVCTWVQKFPSFPYPQTFRPFHPHFPHDQFHFVLSPPFTPP